MSIAEIQKEISKLSAVEKSKIYGHYLCKMIALKHSFAIMETVSEDNRIVKANNGEDFRLKGNIYFAYLWKDVHIMSAEEFNKEFIYTWYYRFFT